MPGTCGFMEINGVRLEYAWYGPGPDEAPTIVLMHEGLGCVSRWHNLTEILAERTGCGVLAYSRQGYGRSDPAELPRPLTFMEDEAADVLPKIIDHWSLKKVFLAGHSDGATISALYAGGVQDHRIRAVILMSPHFFNEPDCIASVLAAKRDYEGGDMRQRLARHHGDNVDCAFYGWCDPWTDPRFANWEMLDHLTHIRVPVLLIWGARETFASFAQVDAARQACQCPLEVVVLDDTVHWPHREQPERTLDAVCGFLSHLMTVHGETVAA